MQPKATYYDMVLQSDSLMSTTEIAKDYGMSAKKFNQMLKELKVQYAHSGRWFLYARYDGYGYVQSKTHRYKQYDGTVATRTQMYWTQKGRLFLYGLLREHGVWPDMEQPA